MDKRPDMENPLLDSKLSIDIGTRLVILAAATTAWPTKALSAVEFAEIFDQIEEQIITAYEEDEGTLREKIAVYKKACLDANRMFSEMSDADER